MFRFRKSREKSATSWLPATQLPNEAFPLPQGTTLRALEEISVALPKAILQEDETIGSIIVCEDDAEFGIDTGRDCFIVRLQNGMTIRVNRSSQAMLIAEDNRPRRVEVLNAD